MLVTSTAVYYMLIANIYTLNREAIHFIPTLYALSFWALPFVSTFIFYKLEGKYNEQQNASKLNTLNFVFMYIVLFILVILTKDQYKLSSSILEQEVIGLHIVMFLVGLPFNWIVGKLVFSRIFEPRIKGQQQT